MSIEQVYEWRSGGIGFWNHETPDEPEPVEEDFPGLLPWELRELEERTGRRMRNEHESGAR